MQLSTVRKNPGKTPMVESFLSTISDLPESFSPKSCLGISGILKTPKAKGSNLNAYNLLKSNSITELFLETSGNFHSTCQRYSFLLEFSGAATSRL